MAFRQFISFPFSMLQRWRNTREQKIFCIGKNKTGTTSMARMFADHGYIVGKQSKGELLLKDWSEGRFDRIISFARDGGQFFQDIPFSLSDTYKHLDRAFPNSKFILTIRDSPEVWYASLVRSQSKNFGNGHLPSKEDLTNARYRYPGFAWDVNRLVYQAPESDIYQREHLMRHYTEHNDAVIGYFATRPYKLLVVNLKNADAGERITHFVGSRTKMIVPWENKSSE